MVSYPSENSVSFLKIRGDLDQLIRRLKKGMVLNGRIIEYFGNDRYLLRIFGYNIYTESKKRFERFEEIQLRVLQVTPHLILDLYHIEPHIQDQSRGQKTDIVIN